MADALRDPVAILSAGPVAAYPSVSRAMARPLLYDYDRQFQEFYEAAARKAARALRTRQPALILHVEPAPGIEAAAASLIGPDDVVLNLVSGVYGAGFTGWARRYAKAVHEVAVPFDDAIDPEAVAVALRRHPETRIVSVVHHDTPSGTINPVREIGGIVRAHGALLLVDAVSSFAGMDIHPDDCEADVFITGPGKCLGGAPGLTVMAVSDRAWAAMHDNPRAPRASVLSLLDWKEAWRADQPFPFTPSVAEMYGLDAALDQYLAEGAASVWARHATTARACRAGLEALGLKLWPARPAIASPTTTAVRIPEGLSGEHLLAAARERLGVVLSGGRGETQGKLLRIGHMGPVAEPLYATVAVTALGAALRQHGHRCDIGAAVEAALAAIG
ncbi:MAG TPA: alanine--glyoxylate aminotransferase family protein [Acetobacteraceae bacterium]|nr:alanine--glyoxylate aminotransferase family protein [Acetobacteraceae bacterium]